MFSRFDRLEGPLVLLIALLAFAAPRSTLAQGTITIAGRPVEARSKPNVFFDCSGPITCLPDLHRIEIPWVNWVTNREDADVHLISTRQDLGGGNFRMTVRFEGLGDRAHIAEEIWYTTPGTDVMRDRQDGFTRVLKLGLLRYALEGGLGSDLDLTFDPEVFGVADDGTDGAVPASDALEPYDPWNYWSFRVGATGNLSDQANRSSHRMNLNFDADRITETWKLSMASTGTLLRERISLSGGREVRNDRDNWNVSMILVRSLGQHVSTGVDVSGGKFSTNNRTGQFSVNPAVEWNFFPYDETARRQLIAHYGAGYRYAGYEEETLFNVTEETIPFHRLGIQYSAVETWGTASVRANASQYLHEGGLYSYGIQGNLTFRIVRGLDLSLNASADRIADEINIPRSDLSDEDILLGRQALPTSYSYQGSVGLTYRFGSTFANIVNARFPSAVR